MNRKGSMMNLGSNRIILLLLLTRRFAFASNLTKSQWISNVWVYVLDLPEKIRKKYIFYQTFHTIYLKFEILKNLMKIKTNWK